MFDLSLKFGEVSSDHMLEIEWHKDKGWDKPKISPFHTFKIHPFNSTIHYALACFEGLKAYKGADKKIRLFRPLENMERLQTSFERLAFPVSVSY